MTQKYSAHLPLYRQEQQLAYQGVILPRQNMANWIMKGVEVLTPLYERLHSLMLAEKYLHADESPMQVLSEPGKPAKSKSYMWVYATGRYRKRIVIYEYSHSRSGENPKRFLSGFDGILQTDAYGAYNTVDNVTRMLCWAHARREYVDALKALPKGVGTQKTFCAEALVYIRQFPKMCEAYLGFGGFIPKAS